VAAAVAWLQVVGGCDNVVAIVPKGAKLDTVTESTDAVIIRATDAAAALELRKRLTASANQMSAVAGLLDVSLLTGGHIGQPTQPPAVCQASTAAPHSTT
jgi:hypothetical protein